MAGSFERGDEEQVVILASTGEECGRSCAQPSAETTVATGTYQVEQTSTQPAAGSHETYGSSDRPGADSGALGAHPGTRARPAAPVSDEADMSAPPAATGWDQSDQAHARAAAPGSGRPGEAQAAARGLDQADPAPRPADPGSHTATDWSAAPAPGDAPTQSAPSGSNPAAEPSAAPGQDWTDPAQAHPTPPARDWLDPAEARPAAHAPDRTDQAPAEPARPAASGPDEAVRSPEPGPGDPAEPAASGQDETDQAGARPFVIRSLDDNPVELRPGTAQGAAVPYGDAVSDLVHAAAADRPLEEVVALITSLEESPDHAEAKVEALRTAGVDRPVEDVSRLIALLTKPPRDADCADEAIRAAAAHRPVEEVTRLVTLLHKEPQMPHVREEALRAAATRRSVGELVELIDRLGLERLDRNGRLPAGTSGPDDATGKPEKPGRPGKRRAARPASAPETRVTRETRRTRTLDGSPADRVRATDRLARSVSWSGWLAALALALCAVAHFPLQRGGASLRLHAFGLGLSALCTVLALLLALRPVAVVPAGAVVVPTVLAAAQAYGNSFPSASLSRAVDLALAPPWVAAASAVCAALLALVALVFRTVAPLAGRQWAPAPTPEARQTAQ
ncbi:hypothetical protein [Streptomyces sp. NPDC050416]|uniref:hypothetical protein n=1 Tax=Streptomyces sp. NPDC050416 TaxID=3365611 RepID=UPI0037980D0C